MATNAQLTARLAALEGRVAFLEAGMVSLQASDTAQWEMLNFHEQDIIDLQDQGQDPGSTYSVLQGTYMPGVPWDTAAWDAYEAAAGKKQGIVHYGQSWWEPATATRAARYRPWDTRVADMSPARGAFPLIDWSPWDTSVAPVDEQPRFSLAALARGDHDAYIRQWATACATWGKSLVLRPMHEMNGTWYPWSEACNGNQTGQYVQAWRHIVDVFRAAGGTNALWCWCPNKLYPGSIPLAGLYPGDAYVDWIGIDAYSGGVKFPDEPFAQMLKPTYDAVGMLSEKPVMLCEWGYALRASRPAWLTDALAQVFGFERLRAICYFMWSSDDNWDFRTDPASMEAWKEGLSEARYAANEYATWTVNV